MTSSSGRRLSLLQGAVELLAPDGLAAKAARLFPHHRSEAVADLVVEAQRSVARAARGSQGAAGCAGAEAGAGAAGGTHSAAGLEVGAALLAVVPAPAWSRAQGPLLGELLVRGSQASEALGAHRVDGAGASDDRRVVGTSAIRHVEAESGGPSVDAASGLDAKQRGERAGLMIVVPGFGHEPTVRPFIDDGDVLVQLEDLLVAAFSARHAGATMLHAACIQVEVPATESRAESATELTAHAAAHTADSTSDPVEFHDPTTSATDRVDSPPRRAEPTSGRGDALARREPLPSTQRWHVLLVGPSGCGKTSLAHAAMRAGAEVLGDEHVAYDGSTLAALPRAPQYDAMPYPVTHAVPSDWDVDSYVFEGRTGRVVRPLAVLAQPGADRLPSASKGTATCNTGIAATAIAATGRRTTLTTGARPADDALRASPRAAQPAREAWPLGRVAVCYPLHVPTPPPTHPAPPGHLGNHPPLLPLGSAESMRLLLPQVTSGPFHSLTPLLAHGFRLPWHDADAAWAQLLAALRTCTV